LKEGVRGRGAEAPSHDWPGNIRELRNAVSVSILATGDEVTETDVDRLVGDGGRSVAVGEAVAGGALLRAGTFEEFKQAAERAYLLAKLDTERPETGDAGDAAEQLVQEDRAVSADAE
jgi:DNA-binding NtrC family response regulator